VGYDRDIETDVDRAAWVDSCDLVDGDRLAGRVAESEVLPDSNGFQKSFLNYRGRVGVIDPEEDNVLDRGSTTRRDVEAACVRCSWYCRGGFVGSLKDLQATDALRALDTCRTLRTLGSSRALRSLRTYASVFAGKTLETLGTLKTLRAELTLGTLRTTDGDTAQIAAKVFRWDLLGKTFCHGLLPWRSWRT